MSYVKILSLQFLYGTNLTEPPKSVVSPLPPANTAFTVDNGCCRFTTITQSFKPLQTVQNFVNSKGGFNLCYMETEAGTWNQKRMKARKRDFLKY